MGEDSQTLPAQYLATLYEITRKLNSSLDLYEVLNYVMDRVVEVTKAERGFLMLRDERSGIFECPVARGMNHEDLDKPRFLVSRTIVRQVTETGLPLLTDNAQNMLSDVESVVTLSLRSILCVPITVREQVIGVVYVDNRVHAGIFDTTMLDLLAAFASQAGTAIENARLYQIAIEKGRLQRELEVAHQIQRGLLPQHLPQFPAYEVAASWESAQEVAGDFYDCFLLDGGRALGLVIADVSGKGVPAALFMAVARSLLRGNATASLSPEETLRQANRLIMEDAGTSGMFVTVYYAQCEAGGRFVGVNGGHNQPLWWQAKTGALEWLPRGGRALGWFDHLPVSAYEIQLEPGDIVIFYTDGLTEAESPQGRALGEEGLAELIQHHAPACTAEALKGHIEAGVAAFVGDQPPFDDRTLLILRYLGEEAKMRAG
jgi:serine phosphatase RsbU (regulator of sigma subunit)